MTDVVHGERITISAMVDKDQAEWLREQARKESTRNRRVYISEVLRDVIALGKTEYLRARDRSFDSSSEKVENVA